MQSRCQPVVNVDAKKKELVGDFKNSGKAPDKGRVTPYGVYDLTANEGWVSVGTDPDTARFAAQTILLKWWREMGRSRYPHAKELLITADGCGFNSSRCWLWTDGNALGSGSMGGFVIGRAGRTSPFGPSISTATAKPASVFNHRNPILMP